MIKKLLLLPLILALTTIHIYGTEPLGESLAQRVQALEARMNAHIPEEIVAPQLSPENEALIKAIAQKLRISEYSLDSWASKEEWLNTFSKSERIYIIGSQLLMTQKLHNISTINAAAHIGLFFAIIGGILYYCPSDYILKSPTPLPANASVLGNIAWTCAQILAPFAAIGGCVLAEQFIFTPFQEVYIRHLVLRTDIQTVKKLGCQEGAISALTKMQNQLLAENNDTQQKLYAFFTKRIENLKALA